MCAHGAQRVMCLTLSGLQDAFKEGNVVQLVPRSTGYPLMVKASSVSGNGSFVNKDSEWIM